MLSDLKALRQIKAAARLYRLCQIGGHELLWRDCQLRPVYIIPVYGQHVLRATFAPFIHPNTAPTAQIDHRRGLQQRKQQ